MRIFVAGLARSGTTWFSRAVASAPGVHYVHEPDNLEHDVFARVGTIGPVYQKQITPGQRMPRYELMWDLAFAGGWPHGRIPNLAVRVSKSDRIPRYGRIFAMESVARVARRRRPPSEHQLVKSVNAVMALEWIAERYRPRMVVIWRSPLNVLAGFIERGERRPSVVEAIRERYEGSVVWPPPTDDAGMLMWRICSRLGLMLETAARHPDWLVVRHESVASDPIARFHGMFENLGLEWSPAVETFLHGSNRPGSGWDTIRVASEEAEAWKRRLAPDHVRMATELMQRFAEIPNLGGPFAECLAEVS